MTSVRDQIIEKISIGEFVHLDSSNMCLCPVSGNPKNKNKSFKYYSETESWYCWHCGKGGTVIDLYSHIYGTTYNESINELAKTHKIDISEEDKKTIAKKSEIYDIFKFFSDICHDNFLNSKYYEDVKTRRGFTEETIKNHKIGLFDNDIKKLMNKNFKKQDLYDAGFLTEKLNWYFGKRIVYPYLNLKKDPVYFIYRKIEEDPDFMNAKYIKHRKEYIKEPLFGINSINKFNGKPLIITEGITDCMSAIQCEYPCISPVTIRFKKEHHEKILQYSKRFKKVVIINDNEENNKGLEGAKDTLSYLLKNGVNIYINEITRLPNTSKIDLNDYLKESGTNKLNELTDQAIEGMDFLLSSIDEKSTTEELEDILVLIPEGDIRKETDTITILKKKTKIKISNLEALYKLTRSKEKEKLEKQKMNDDIFSDKHENEKEKEELICSYDYKNGMIRNRKDGVYFCITNEDGYVIEELILESPLHLIHKTKFINTDLFSYEFRNDIYNTQSRSDIILGLETFRYGGDRGKDVLKKLITSMGDELEYNTLQETLGFDNGWILPQLQEENNYRILITTSFQKELYGFCKNLINDDYDIRKIKKKVKFFLSITKMNEGKVAMIIGWSMAQLFRLAFIEYFNFAPDLLLIGDPQTGKTAFSKAVIINMINVWKRMLQGSEISTKARFEDACSTSAFPILIDELEYVNYDVVDVMKARSTFISKYTRKTSAKDMFSKPEVAGFCITTNEVPKAFYNSALIERFVVINFSSKEVITENQEWNNLARELKELNMFSPIYYYTKEKEKKKTFDNKEIFKMIENIQQRCPSFTHDARLRKKFIFVFFGLTIFNLIFDIDLTPDLEVKLFEQSGRIITGDLLNDFVNFCNIAIDYDIGSTSQSGAHIRGDNPKFITRQLGENNKGNYIFIPQNLRDFKEFLGNKKYNMRSLCSQLNKSIGEKDYFYYKTNSLDGKIYTSIKIPVDFNDKIKSLKNEV